MVLLNRNAVVVWYFDSASMRFQPAVGLVTLGVPSITVR